MSRDALALEFYRLLWAESNKEQRADRHCHEARLALAFKMADDFIAQR